MIKDTFNLRGRLFSLDSPKVMGILNVTPDSFFDGGKFVSKKQAILQVETMINQGADIIDIGGMSSRPKSVIISEQVEWERIQPILKLILSSFPDALVSVDTFRYGIMEKALDLGVHIINDISAFQFDDSIPTLLAKHKILYILMHMQGDPQSMQTNPTYENVVREVLDFFIDKNRKLESHGVQQVCLDPGFGFGKSIDHNYKLLQRLEIFKILDLPILAGLSRKSMIYTLLDIDPKDSLHATSSLNLLALMNGASILRVHDVKEAKQVVKLFKKIQDNS